MATNTYTDAVKNIIKQHIKFAVYIDENARESFKPSSVPELFEEKLSFELYEEFSKYDVELSTYKYSSIPNYKTKKNYILNGRDLVLLDWKLDGRTGEDQALEVISDIIHVKPRISFCVVYTHESTDEVFKNILSFFSGITKQECDDIRLQLLLEGEENFHDFKSKLDEIVLHGSFDKEETDNFINAFPDVFESDSFKTDSDRIKLIKCWCTYSDFQKNSSNQIKVSSYKESDKTLIIGNTFFVILNKEATGFAELLSKFTQIIADYPNGFPLLMNLEINNIMQNKGMMMDPRIINLPQELFAYHKMQDRIDFDFFIKEVQLNSISLSLMDEQLSTIQSLQNPPKTYEPKIEELISINTFYDSIKRPSETNLVFGDVFKYEDGAGETCFYICITPLCDCANPKNENTFYFAKGQQITDVPKIKKLIKHSEELFISFLPNNIVVKWANSTSDKDKPLYITPIPLTIPKITIKDNHLYAYQLMSKISKKKKIDLQYIGTIKQNYAQRIANHAFMHSIRVGITFVSILK